MPRSLALWIHFVLDQWLPPIVRDFPPLAQSLLWLAFGKKWRLFATFKDRAPGMSAEAFCQAYQELEGQGVQRQTDLNLKCQALIVSRLRKGERVLEVGCGRGYLAEIMARTCQVTAVDILVEDRLRQALPHVTFANAPAERLPFSDQEFDLVVCTHVLEHVQNFQAAFGELRRVAKRMIVVVPKQRPYQFTFDLHLRFFPYPHSFLLLVPPGRPLGTCQVAGGDIFYEEGM